MYSRSYVRTFACLALSAMFTACGGGGGGGSSTPPPPPPAKQSQTLTFASASLIAYSSEQLTNKATGQGSGAVTYSSGNTNVATVDSQGNITAVGPGTTNISASIAT